MVENNLKKIFLSASIPYAERDEKYYSTADILAIRDSIRALATVVIPKAHLIWGGHPTITPLIRFVMELMKADIKSHITMYQSNYFRDFFSEDNSHFENIKIITSGIDRESSLKSMRERMIKENNFSAGIFIGGMEGVIEEYHLFKSAHPQALIIPIASTGAASQIIYNLEQNTNPKLKNDYAYMALFRELLREQMKFFQL